MIKNIIFDWSGTLIDDNKEVYKVCTKMFAKLGKEMISYDQFRREMTVPYMKFYNKYFPDLTMEKQKELYKEAYRKAEETPLHAGVKDLLQEWHTKGINLAIVSSEPSQRITKEGKKENVLELFLEIVSDVHEKEEALNKMMIEQNFLPTETIFVGDTQGDVEAGKTIDIKTAAISWGIQCEEKLKESEPTVLIKELKELNLLLDTGI